jgi:hypothetical protein
MVFSKQLARIFIKEEKKEKQLKLLKNAIKFN